jgi:hypothetical protein
MIDKKKMACNKPRPLRRGEPGFGKKKRVVKACENGEEKIIKFGAKGYGHNYSDEARRSFRARHKCGRDKSKMTASYWACKNLWSKSSPKKQPPK